MNYLNCKKIETAIRRAKQMLIKKAKKEGLYENFGIKEERAIKDKFIDISDYSEEMKSKRRELSFFSNWCANYEG